MLKTTLQLLAVAAATSALAAVEGCESPLLDPSTGSGPVPSFETGGSSGTGGSAGSPATAGSTGSGTGGRSGTGGSSGTGGMPSIINPPPSKGPAGIAACGTTLLALGATGRIAFDSDRDNFNRDIYFVGVNGAVPPLRLTSDPSIEKEPSLAHDGRRVAFASDRSGTFQIYVLDMQTMQVTQVTTLADGADQPSFSHDGNLIAFHSGASVWVVRPNGTGATQIATGLDDFNAYFWPHFSADDGELVFDRNNEIDAIHLDGSGMRMIVQNWTTTIKSPAVSPNGVDVAYHVYCDGGLSVWTTPFSTNTNPCEGRRVTPADEPDSQRPAWGPNNLIAYERVDRTTNVASIAVISRDAGSVPCAFDADGADDRNPSWNF